MRSDYFFWFLGCLTLQGYLPFRVWNRILVWNPTGFHYVSPHLPQILNNILANVCLSQTASSKQWENTQTWLILLWGSKSDCTRVTFPGHYMAIKQNYRDLCSLSQPFPFWFIALSSLSLCGAQLAAGQGVKPVQENTWSSTEPERREQESTGRSYSERARTMTELGTFLAGTQGTPK